MGRSHTDETSADRSGFTLRAHQMRHYNLNGSSPHSVLSDALGTLDSLRAVQVSIADLVPHGRDYQGAPDGLFESDRADYRAAIAALAEVYDYVHNVATHASDASGEVRP